MRECEVKILGVEVEGLKKALINAGAECVFSGMMEVCYFDHSDNRIRKAGELFRLRRMGERVELTYKRDFREEGGCKMAEELEVTVSDFEEAQRIILATGLKLAKTYSKLRHHFKKNQVHFVIDEYPGLDPYLEIEASTPHGVEEWIMDLGLQNLPRSTKTFDQLLLGGE